MPKPSRSTDTFQMPLYILICIILVGCPSRKPVSSTSTSFHLQSVDGGLLLLSPNLPAQQSVDAPITLTLGAKSDAPANSDVCTATEGEFRLESDTNSPDIHAVLPPLKSWLFGFKNSSGSDENNTIESLYAILADVDRAQAAGCFAATHAQARDYILQSIPTRPSDSLFNAYGYRIERSAVNLKPGLRLKIERAYFSGAEKSEKNYLGLSNVLFDVTTDPEGSLRFQQVHAIQYSPDSLAQSDREGSRDLAILDLKPQLHYRVLFYTHQVPTDQNFSAALIGSDDSARLDEFEHTIRADASASCSSSTHEEVQCIKFRGFVTVGVQIPIELNGKPQFVDWGTKVKTVVPAKSRKSLKIQRQFANSYFAVRFKLGDENILDLTLVGGDHLSW